MRTPLLLLSLLLVGFTIPTQTVFANAMVVIDIEAGKKMVTQLKELKKQTDFLKKQLNKLSPYQYQWSNAFTLINELGRIMERSNAISYSASDIDRRFKHQFPGYQTSKNYSEHYQTMVNTSQQTINNTLVNFGMSAKDFETESKRLQFLQQQSQSAEGQMQVIQVANQLASEQITQLQLLRQTLMAQSTAQETYYALKIQEEAYYKAELIQVLEAGSTDIIPYGSSGDDFKVPKF